MEMMNDYIFNVSKSEQDDHVMQVLTLKEWSINHKTIVLLNGGNSADLLELHEFMKDGARQQLNEFPYAKFNEDEQSLCGALTSVGIVLPPHIYDTAAMDRRAKSTSWISMFEKDAWVHRPIGLNAWEEELIVRLNQYGLAK